MYLVGAVIHRETGRSAETTYGQRVWSADLRRVRCQVKRREFRNVCTRGGENLNKTQFLNGFALSVSL